MFAEQLSAGQNTGQLGVLSFAPEELGGVALTPTAVNAYCVGFTETDFSGDPVPRVAWQGLDLEARPLPALGPSSPSHPGFVVPGPSRPSSIQKRRLRLRHNSCLAPPECLRCGPRREPRANMLPLGESGLPLESQRPIKTRGKTASPSPRAPGQLLPLLPRRPHEAAPGVVSSLLPPHPGHLPLTASILMPPRPPPGARFGGGRERGKGTGRREQLPDFRLNCCEER